MTMWRKHIKLILNTKCSREITTNILERKNNFFDRPSSHRSTAIRYITCRTEIIMIKLSFYLSMIGT